MIRRTKVLGVPVLSIETDEQETTVPPFRPDPPIVRWKVPSRFGLGQTRIYSAGQEPM